MGASIASSPRQGLLRLDHDWRVERQTPLGVELGIDRSLPVAGLRQRDDVDLPAAVLSLRGRRRDWMAPWRCQRQRQSFGCEWFKVVAPQPNRGARRADTSGHNGDVSHARVGMDVNKGGVVGDGRIVVRVARRRHSAEKADHCDCGEAQSGFGQAGMAQDANGARDCEPRRQIEALIEAKPIIAANRPILIRTS